MEAWSKYPSDQVSEATVKILSKVCHLFGISPYTLNRRNQIEVNLAWKDYSIIFAGLFLLLSLHLLAHVYSLEGLIPQKSFFLYVFASLAAEALSYSFASLYHGQSLARAMTVLSQLEIPSSENRKIKILCLSQCSPALYITQRYKIWVMSSPIDQK